MNRRRTVACYCATFLKPEMLHIYRQISAVRQFKVAVLTGKRENAEAFPFDDVTVVPRGPWRWLRRVVIRQWMNRPVMLSGGETRRLRAALESKRAALLHIFFGNTAVQLLPLLADQTRIRPVIVSFHGADVLVDLDNQAYKTAFLDVLGRVDLVLARSQSLIKALIDLGCPPEKIRLNRTGIPLAKFPFQDRLPPEDGRWHLLQACRLVEKKGLPTTLRAFAQFAKTWPRATLTIAGEGPQLATLQRLSAELGVGAQVKFAGFLDQDQLGAQMYQAHFFLHPSEQTKDGNQEGVPNSLLEAMATGLPVLATRHGGIPEAIEDGVTGFLVNEGDHDAIAQTLLRLAENPDRAFTTAKAGAKVVEEHFSLPKQARRLEEYYQEAMEEAWISPDAGKD